MSSKNLFDLSGRVAVVTGGNGGIGRGMALGLAQAGAAVAVVARNEQKNRRVVNELQQLGVPAIAVEADLAQREQLPAIFQQIEKKLGPVNILVNDAGIVVLGGVLELSPEDWDRVFETNLNAMVAPIKEMPLYDDVIKRTPAGRFGTPEECAGTAIYLASHASDFVTGATIYLDGGFAVQL